MSTPLSKRPPSPAPESSKRQRILSRSPVLPKTEYLFLGRPDSTPFVFGRGSRSEEWNAKRTNAAWIEKGEFSERAYLDEIAGKGDGGVNGDENADIDAKVVTDTQVAKVLKTGKTEDEPIEISDTTDAEPDSESESDSDSDSEAGSHIKFVDMGQFRPACRSPTPKRIRQAIERERERIREKERQRAKEEKKKTKAKARAEARAKAKAEAKGKGKGKTQVKAEKNAEEAKDNGDVKDDDVETTFTRPTFGKTSGKGWPVEQDRALWLAQVGHFCD